MAEDVTPSEFSQTPPEPSEKEQIQNRINNFKVGVTPQVAQITSALLESHLKNGQAKLTELEALIAVRDDVTNGLAEYNRSVEVATNRLNEIAVEEQQEKEIELAKRREHEKQKLVEERQLRKTLEDRVKQLEAQLSGKPESPIADVEEGLHGFLDSSEEPVLKQEQPDWKPYTPPTLQPEKPKSKAWDLIRAGRPKTVEIEEDNITEEPAKGLDDVTPEEWDNANRGLYHHLKTDEERLESVAKDGATLHQSEVTTPFTEDKELAEKVEETKQAFKDFSEEEIKDWGEDLPVESFNDEDYEDVAEDQTAWEEWQDTEDSLPDLEDIESEFNVTQDDTESEPDFSKPIVSAGNAPSVRKTLSSGDSVEAKVPDLKIVTTADTEEELLEKLKEKYADEPEPEPEEEEYDEIVIPSRSELEGLTKAKIKQEADRLDFDVNATQSKAKMIDEFVLRTEEFIQSLTEDEESGFISATETDEDGETNGDDDHRDGGYF